MKKHRKSAARSSIKSSTVSSHSCRLRILSYRSWGNSMSHSSFSGLFSETRWKTTEKSSRSLRRLWRLCSSSRAYFRLQANSWSSISSRVQVLTSTSWAFKASIVSPLDCMTRRQEAPIWHSLKTIRWLVLSSSTSRRSRVCQEAPWVLISKF